MKCFSRTLGFLFVVSLSAAACSDETPAKPAIFDGGVEAGPDGGDSGADSSDAGGDAAEGGGGELANLKRLGAKVDLPVAPVDSKGKPLPGGYHPLRKPIAAIDPRHEIYFAGPSFGGQREGILDDGFTSSNDFEGIYGEMLSPADPTWYQNPFRAAIPADIDGDGVQEIVAVYLNNQKKLYAKVIHGPEDGRAAREDLPFVLASDVTLPTYPADWFPHAVIAANVDDDPAEELIVGVDDLVVYDDPAHDFAPLLTETLNSSLISLTTGDFDAAPLDPHDEWFVTYAASAGVGHYRVYDGLEKMFDRSMSTNLNDGAGSQVSFPRALVAAGNFDGDPADEIAILGEGFHLMLIDDAAANYAWFNSFYENLPNDNSNLVAVDIDGDHRDELVAVHWIFDGLENIPPSSSTTAVPDLRQLAAVPRTDLALTTFQIRAGNVSPVGDDNQRPRADELVAIDHNGGRLVVGGYGPTGTFGWTSLGPITNQVFGDVLALANVDHDSEIVRFTGDHEVLYSDPKIIVAMSAPPFYAGTNQEQTSSTSFGTGDSHTAERSNSVGYSVGFSFGYESSDPFGIYSASFKVSVEQAFDSVATTSSTQSEVITYTSGAEDSVVFSVVPFDVYYYTVTSAVDPEQVGRTLSINIPRKIQTLLASSKYFDENVKSTLRSAPLFTHTVGDPHSYPTVAQRNTLCGDACFKASQARTVGQGTGFTTLEISTGNGKGQGTSYDLNVTVESEFGVGGVTAGASAGFHYGYSVETTTETSTIFTGQLGSLENLTPDKTYSAGIFAYRSAAPGGGKDVLLVDYWVE